MSNADNFVFGDPQYKAYSKESKKLEKRLAKLEQDMKLRRKELISQFCAEYSVKHGFKLQAGMRVICSVEMHEFAEKDYGEKYPHRNDLADHHFPVGYDDMGLVDITDDAIELGGYGSSMKFPVDLIKRAVRYYKDED